MLTLWESYRATAIRPRYDLADVQACYLLRYFPSYTLLLPHVLGLVGEDFDQEEINVSFFGAGPAPEFVGLINYLRNRSSATSINCSLFDSSAQWEFARAISLGAILRSRWPRKDLSLEEIATDLTRRWEPNGLELTSGDELDLAVFQNCLNELTEPGRQMVRRNVGRLIDRMPRHSLITFIEPANYDLQGLSGTRVLLKPDARNVSCLPVLRTLPDMVEEARLLVRYPKRLNGRILATSVDFHSLVLQKR